MQWVRFSLNGRASFGLLEDGRVRQVDGDPITDPENVRPGRESWALSQVQLLAPLAPGKIVAIGRNYSAHAAEMGNDVPEEPLMFLKPPSSVIGPDETIILPKISENVEHEAELVAVIGREARHVQPDEALLFVFGYTGGNDVTARDLQRRDGQWSRAKGFDTFTPLGPVIQTDLSPGNLSVRCLVNGQVRQDSNTKLLVFDLPALIAHITQAMTLFPGDCIMTGTPDGVGPLQAGDEVVVEIESIGSLCNRVAAADR
ncbi:MAG: fumarylacetoacetate hydrolase family protein [Thermaerobacterales bacterium]